MFHQLFTGEIDSVTAFLKGRTVINFFRGSVNAFYSKYYHWWSDVIIASKNASNTRDSTSLRFHFQNIINDRALVCLARKGIGKIRMIGK